MTALATAKKFDTTMTADTGDAWASFVAGTGTVNPLVLGPGESGEITLQIQPTANEVGRTVTGFVYIDTFNLLVGTGDEVVRLPYTYTVVK